MSLINGASALADAQLAITVAAKRELAIRVQQLDYLPENTAFTDALLQLVKRYPQSRIRILYSELGLALENGHGIIGLRRRLPSSIFLRQCDERDANDSRQWWLGDRFALLLQADASRPQANLDTFAKAAGPQYLDLFEDAWQRSREDVRLREIFL